MQTIFKNETGPTATHITLESCTLGSKDLCACKRDQFMVSLMDISADGARLKLLSSSDTAPNVGDTFFLNIRLPVDGLEGGAIPCRASWVETPEVCVAFSSEPYCL